MIRRKAVTERVLCPVIYASGETRLLERLPKTVLRCDVAFVLAQWQEPLAQIWLHRHEAALRCLGLRGFDFD
jgi:hypothetical protein